MLVYGSTWAYREGVGGERNVDGNAVADAEVMVGKTMVYTGAVTQMAAF